MSLLGFLALDLLYVIDNVLVVPILLALYIALRKTNESSMLIAAALGFIGMLPSSLPTRPPACRPSAGNTRLQPRKRSVPSILAAGEALLAGDTGTAYHVSLILGSDRPGDHFHCHAAG